MLYEEEYQGEEQIRSCFESYMLYRDNVGVTFLIMYIGCDVEENSYFSKVPVILCYIEYF